MSFSGTCKPFTPVAGRTGQTGELWYNADDDCLSFVNSDTTGSLEIGQEEWLRAKNVTGATILNGKPVYVSGVDAGTGLATIALAKGDSDPVAFAVGIATQDIANNAVGRVTTRGIVHGLDTSGFSAGAIVYVSTVTAGLLTSTAPTFPYLKTRIGSVLTSSATVGTILVSNPATTVQRMGSVRNSAIFTKTTDTTLADIPGLSFNVLAGGIYAFEAVLQVTPSAVGGHKYAIGGTATATALLAQVVSSNGLTSVINSQITALATGVGATGGTAIFTRIFGTIAVNAAGTITIQFAQNASSTSSSVLANSAFQMQTVNN